MTNNNYPTEETLKAIETWPHTDIPGLIEYVKGAWSDPNRIWEENGELKMSTGGWSGNEEIVLALQRNLVFWGMCWQSSHRGGLEVFRVSNAQINRRADSSEALSSENATPNEN